MNALPDLPIPEPVAPSADDVRAAEEIAKDLRLSMFGDDFERLCLHMAMHRLRGEIDVHKAQRDAAALGLTRGTA